MTRVPVVRKHRMSQKSKTRQKLLVLGEGGRRQRLIMTSSFGARIVVKRTVNDSNSVELGRVVKRTVSDSNSVELGRRMAALGATLTYRQNVSSAHGRDNADGLYPPNGTVPGFNRILREIQALEDLQKTESEEPCKHPAAAPGVGACCQSSTLPPEAICTRQPCALPRTRVTDSADIFNLRQDQHKDETLTVYYPALLHSC